MNKIITNVLITIGLLVFFTNCSQENEDTSVTIIQTTDVHGSLFPFNFIENKENHNSLASVAYYVDSLRKANGERVILLDNGDFFQGQPSVYYYNYEDTVQKNLGARVLNYMKYDAITIGNHDIECGHKVYDKLNNEINAPWLAANIINTKTGEPYFNPYTIIERNGIKVAVLGLITPAIPDWIPEKLWEGMVFEDMVESAKKWVKIIQEKEKPDLLVGMFHAGMDYNYNKQTKDTYKNENASQLVAEQVPGFDLILAGHDHKKANKSIVNVAGDTVYLLDAMSSSKAVAKVKIDFIRQKSTNVWEKHFNTEIVDMAGIKHSKAYMQEFMNDYTIIENYVNREIGLLKTKLTTKDSYFGNSAFTDFIHQVQFANSSANVSFTAPLSFNITIPKGPIYIRDLFKLYKYENLLYTINLTGREIDKYLEYSAGIWFNQMKNKNDHLLLLKQSDEGHFSLENKYYNLSTAGGIEYLVDVSKPVGRKVRILGFSDGSNFYNDSTYRVVVNSYRGSGGGGHFTTGVGLSKDELKARIVDVSKQDFRFMLMKWIEEKHTIKVDVSGNWRIIPEDYYEWGKNKDFKLLFNK